MQNITIDYEKLAGESRKDEIRGNDSGSKKIVVDC